MSVIEVYERHGVTWAKLRGDQLAEGRWLDRFCRALPAGAEVLDIGCGSGLPIAKELIAQGMNVTGIDASATMLTLFRHNVPEAAAQQLDMRELALPQQFDGLIAWDSFFHLSPEDQRPMFARFQAHAASGAMLMFTSGTYEGSAIGELGGDPLYHGSLDPDEYRALLCAGGFEVIDYAPEDPTCGGRTIWLARKCN